MRVKANIEFQVAKDTDLENALWARTKESLNAVIRDDCNVQSSGVRRLAAAGSPPAASPETLPMGDIATGYFLFIEADQEITVTLNGGTEQFTVKPLTTYKGFLFWHGSYTSAPTVENQANVTATVDYCLVGIEA